MKYSYDYEDFLIELNNDVNEGLIRLSDDVKVVRSEQPVFSNYHAVIDYYYDDENCDEIYEVMKVSVLLEEMNNFNEIL